MRDCTVAHTVYLALGEGIVDLDDPGDWQVILLEVRETVEDTGEEPAP